MFDIIVVVREGCPGGKVRTFKNSVFAKLKTYTRETFFLLLKSRMTSLRWQAAHENRTVVQNETISFVVVTARRVSKTPNRTQLFGFPLFVYELYSTNIEFGIDVLSSIIEDGERLL